MGVLQEEGRYLREECGVPGNILLQLCLSCRQFLSKFLEALQSVMVYANRSRQCT